MCPSARSILNREEAPMKLTKFEHACFAVTKDSQTLIVDPGNWSTDFTTPTDVVAVVITHEHADHFDQSKLQKIAAQNPQAVVVAHETITKQITVLPTKSVVAGDSLTIGPFTLDFYGGQHATIYQDYPRVDNLGVMINKCLYYPGDSFSLPEQPVDTLALPVSAPWMKISEAMDFCKAIDANLVFPTHDAILSDTGKSLVDRLVSSVASRYLRINDSIEING